jgi:hypothetical protein
MEGEENEKKQKKSARNHYGTKKMTLADRHEWYERMYGFTLTKARKKARRK